LTDDTCLLSFYLFEFTTQETITAKIKHFVFFKVLSDQKKFLKLQHRTQKAIFLPEQKD